MKYESKMDEAKESKVDLLIQDANDRALMMEAGKAALKGLTEYMAQHDIGSLVLFRGDAWHKFGPYKRDAITAMAQSVRDFLRAKGEM